MKSINQLFLLKFLTGNEKGSVMNIALLILLLISLIVFAGSKTSSVDIKISTNKKQYERDFYIAEGLTSQMVKILENTRASDVEDLKDNTRSGWPGGLLRQADLTDGLSVATADWAATGVSVNWPNTAAWPGGNPRSATDSFQYISVDQGVVEGGSLSVIGSRTYKYNVQGKALCGTRDVGISLGYKIRF